MIGRPSSSSSCRPALFGGPREQPNPKEKVPHSEGRRLKEGQSRVLAQEAGAVRGELGAVQEEMGDIVGPAVAPHARLVGGLPDSREVGLAQGEWPTLSWLRVTSSYLESPTMSRALPPMASSVSRSISSWSSTCRLSPRWVAGS